jgi:4'-phosphopantetheinyl transferase
MSKVFCGIVEIAHENFNKLKDHESGLKLFEIRLSSYYDLVPELMKYLNAAELQRAQKYHFEKDSNQFIICRTLLKFILAQHTGLHIDNIHIEIDTNKKPYLSSNETICFNVSHAADFAIIAVNNHPIGIDIEYINKSFDFLEILESIFSLDETEAVLSAENNTDIFYKFWTRKEAIVKATGQGISDHLIQIPVIDGHHTVSSKLLDGFKDLKVLSFNLNEYYIASLALSRKKTSFDSLLIYNLPVSMEGLVIFSCLKT